MEKNKTSPFTTRVFILSVMFVLAIATANAGTIIAKGTTDWDEPFEALWNATLDTAYKAANFTSNYDARADRFGNANFTSLAIDANIANDLTIQTTSSLTIGGGFGSSGTTIDTSGNIFTDGNIFLLGNISNVNVGSVNVNGSFMPTLDNLFDIGNSTLRWRNGNFSGSVFANDITATTLNGLSISTLNRSVDLSSYAQTSQLSVYQIEASAFKKANFTSLYDARSDRFGKANYSSEYASTGYKLANLTGYLNGGSVKVGIGSSTAASTLSVTGNMSVSTVNNTIGNMRFGQYNSSCDGFRTGTTGGWILSCT